MKRLLLFAVLACAFPSFAQSPATTTISDTIYTITGTPQTGSITISNPPFISPDGYAIAANSVTVTLSSNGAFSVALVPTIGGRPAGTYYSITITPTLGPPRIEQWSVPYFPTPLVVGQVIITGPGTPIPSLAGDANGSYAANQVDALHFGSQQYALPQTTVPNDCIGIPITGNVLTMKSCSGGGGGGGGGGANPGFTFTNQSGSFMVSHLLGTPNLIGACYDTSGADLHCPYSISQTAPYNVTFNLGPNPVTGYVVLNGSGPSFYATTETAASIWSIPQTTHKLGTSVNASSFDANGIRIIAPVTVAGNGNVTVNFANASVAGSALVTQ